MNVLLSCDDVFEALTSGCDADRADEAVVDHLECCAQCRQLAEATEPAANRFAQAMRTNARVSQTAVSLANTVFARLEGEHAAVLAASHRRNFLSLSAYAWSQLGAIAAIFLAMGGLFWAASPGTQSGGRDLAALPPFVSPLAGAVQPSEYGLLDLASLRLPPKCLTTPAVSPSAAALYQCCTRCHQAGDLVAEVRLVAFSQQTCTACHKS
jgi:hypothetical protein